MSAQKALFLVDPAGTLAVREYPVPTPGPGEILVEIHAAALNPVDWKMEESKLVKAYPAVIGIDAAGIVHALGEGVTGLVVGDKVLHQGFFTSRNASFQQYAVVPAELAAKIPDNITFDQAATIPMSLATAALALYNPKPAGVGLEFAWEESGRGKYAGQPFLVIGGASSVGQHAIQFAKLSGFSPIITTASPTNETYLKSLGATHIISRAHPLSSIPSSIAAITSTPILHAFDAISIKDTQEAAYAALAPGGTLALVGIPDIAHTSDDKRVLAVIGSGYLEANRPVAVSLYRRLTDLIAVGDIRPNNVEVLPGGLYGIPEGVERLKEGKVHAVKLVARPQETA